jgi:predicted ATP-dependent endonuclease of OLD family
MALELTGFRKFQQAQIEIDGPVTAIVGPNEAGKTSILTALTRLEDTNPIESRDRTRTADVSDEDVVLAALYLVEPADREVISDLPGGDDPQIARWLIHSKLASGRRRRQLIAPLKRDLKPRRAAKARLATLLKAAPWDPAGYDPSHPLSQPALDVVTGAVDSDVGTLPADELQAIQALASELAAIEGSAATVGTVLSALSDHESAGHPNQIASGRLADRIPPFLFFGEVERDLRTDYDLSSTVSDDPPLLQADAPPRALENLALLAELDLSQLRTAIESDETGKVRRLLNEANARLRSVFSAYSQEQISTEFDHIGNYILRIHVRDESGELSNLDERSDGVKIFVSLLAATARERSGTAPIVLIDELERHLHYDAQADVVQVLTRQDYHPQVIYTTHSAGCLPEDLGAGVRVVRPIPPEQRSDIENRFWSGGTGFAPLLLGMGASTLAFVPVRNAVLTEGGSDVVLLPTLIREAIDRKSLDFQVAPASAIAPASHIAGLDLEAPKVVWVVDGDEAGRKIKKRLEKDHGIPPQRIKILAGQRSKKVLEDLLLPDIYVRAVNAEFERSGVAERLSTQRLPETDRPGYVKRWCSSKKVPAPNKVSVANRVLDLLHDRDATPRVERLLSSDGRKRLRELHGAIIQQFKR